MHHIAAEPRTHTSPASWRAQLRSRIPTGAGGATLPQLALYLPAAVVWITWIAGAYLSGGYFARDWYPAAIALVALLAVVVFAGERALPRPKAARLALAAFGALVVWSYLSLLWAGSPASAWEASNELLLFFVTAWIISLVPWTARSGAAFLALWSLGVAGVCVVSLLGALAADDLSSFLFEARFQDPIGYPNGNAALAVMACAPALALAYQRSLPPWVQGVLLACAAFLVEFALLAQSRASAIGGVVAIVLFLALAPERLRLAPRLALVVGACGLAAPAIFDVYSTADAGDPVGSVLEAAAGRMALTALAAGVGGLVVGVVERSVTVGEAGARWSKRIATLAVALVAVAGLALLIASAGRIADLASDEWSAFTDGEVASADGGTRFTNTNPYQRPDYWRVSLDLFEESPVVGAGAGNFEREYTARREEEKHSRYPHNIWLGALAETGAVGFVLLAAFVAICFVGSLWRYLRRAALDRAVVTACLVVTGYFLVHASFDWLDEIPALAAPALALPLLALAVVSPGRQEPAGRPSARRSSAVAAAAILGGAALAALALVSLTLPFLSQRYVDRAFDRSQTELREAYRDLRRAASLNPLSSVPYVSEGTIATNVGRYDRARAAFREALDVEETWYPHFELALIEASEGRFQAARREIAAAAALNARDPFVRAARRRILAGERIDPAEFNARIRRETRSTFTTRQP